MEIPVSDTSPFVAAGFRGRAARIVTADIETVAAQIHVAVVALQAVMAVETSGSGFDAAGRPSILFEPHVFFRNLGGDKLQAAMDQGLAYPQWGERPYPPTSDGNYARLTSAYAIDETAALKACSWGLGQILGENYHQALYADVQSMVQAAMDSEFAQLGMMANFIVTNGLVEALQGGDWRTFARRYNGPGYSENHYDTKLANYVTAHGSLERVASATVVTPIIRPAPQTADQLMAAELSQLNGGAA